MTTFEDLYVYDDCYVGGGPTMPRFFVVYRSAVQFDQWCMRMGMNPRSPAIVRLCSDDARSGHRIRGYEITRRDRIVDLPRSYEGRYYSDLLLDLKSRVREPNLA